jgi:DNA recombination protein RmuC
MPSWLSLDNIAIGLAALAAVAAIVACIIAAVAAKKSNQTETDEILLREFKAIREENARLDRNIREESERTRVASERSNKENRDELAQRTDSFRMAMMASFNDFSDAQKRQFETVSQRVEDMTQRNDQSFERVRGTLEEKVRILQEGNEKKLDEDAKSALMEALLKEYALNIPIIGIDEADSTASLNKIMAYIGG